MALTELLSPDLVNDVNTTSNVTSAGIAMAALKISQKQLRYAELAYKQNQETLKELDYSNKYAQMMGERHLLLLKEIVSLLKSIDGRLRREVDE